ncbi:cupredoxin domain-containing protein [Candidatus Falkowbacteria bacterium]|nr:cupredoxin domain-containing protein [Candidatus Falkowbacteria bacterium]
MKSQKVLFGLAMVAVFVLAGCSLANSSVSQVTTPSSADTTALPNTNTGVVTLTPGPSSEPTLDITNTLSNDSANVNTTNTALDQAAVDKDVTVKVVAVSGQNFSFNPAAITVKQGQKVKVNFSNVGGTHDWNLDAFNAHTGVIGDGQTASVEFIADQAGTFEYYCSIGQHRAMGMVGKLIVE